MRTNHVLPVNLDNGSGNDFAQISFQRNYGTFNYDDMLTITVEWLDEKEEVLERKLFDELDEFEQEQILSIIETDEYKNDMFNDTEYY